MSEFNYLIERDRMCRETKRCDLCFFYDACTPDRCGVKKIEESVPLAAYEAVSRWSMDHPAKRNVDVIAEKLAEIGYKVDVDYIAKNCCPPHMSNLFCSECVKCQNGGVCEACRLWWKEEYGCNS